MGRGESALQRRCPSRRMGSRGPPDVGGLISLKVDNFPFNTSAEDLREMFNKYGEVRDCYIPRDHATNQSRGFGFIRYANEDEAEAAIEGCDRKVLQGRELRVQVVQHSRPPIVNRSEMSSRDDRRGYGRDDRRDDRRGDRRDDRRDDRDRDRRDRDRDRDDRRDRDRRRRDDSDSEDRDKRSRQRKRRDDDSDEDDKRKPKRRNDDDDDEDDDGHRR